jgi:hypothetical protein
MLDHPRTNHALDVVLSLIETHRQPPLLEGRLVLNFDGPVLLLGWAELLQDRVVIPEAVHRHQSVALVDVLSSAEIVFEHFEVLYS